MSILINPILCKNYEDYQSYAPAKHYLKNWPAMWPEEAMADRALYEEHKTMRERFPTFMFDHVQWCLRHCDGKTWAKRVPFALASLIMECGWKVRNALHVELYDVSPIYETDIRRMEREEESEPKHDGIEIDMKQLVRVMGDMMPERIAVHHVQRRLIPNEKAQVAALVMLAEEGGWKYEEPTKYNNYTGFFKI